MTPAERERLFARARAAIARDQGTLMVGTRDDIFRLLSEAQKAATEILASAPTDYQRWSIATMSAQIRQALDELNRKSTAAASSSALDAWTNGQQAIDEPLDRALPGARISSTLPAIDTVQLAAMRAFMVDRVKDIGLDAANKIIGELGLVVIGAQSPSDAIGFVQQMLGEKSRDRARTIVRTELGRLYETASQVRKLDAATMLPGLKKQWRRSNKKHPRLHHDLADGQIQAVDEPFTLHPLGKPVVELMYPKDPAAPAGETINCGCTSIPYMEHWEVAHPGRLPGHPMLEDEEPLADILARQPKVTA